jgi:hypothetical protein
MQQPRSHLAVTLLATLLALAVSPAMADPQGPLPDNGPGAQGAEHGQPDKRGADSQQHHAAGQSEHKQPGQPDMQQHKPGADGDHGNVSMQHARQWAHDSGLSGYKALPPGMAKRLARGKPLPAGIDRRPVPPEMLRHLPAEPGREWRIVGDNLVQVVVSTSVVTAVLQGVFN